MRERIKKGIVLLIVVPAVLFTALFAYILVKGPRMTVQTKFRDFQMIPPPPPAGWVSVVPGNERVPAATEAARLKNPLPATRLNLAAGAVYYGYYCVFCHGDGGAGDGPVGNSYVPKPADLRSPKLAAYRDGDLLRASLTGIGHEPVLERVVPPEHRWHLMLFIRSLSSPHPFAAAKGAQR